ncbi:aldehyde dehydrogenase family protein [Neopusillimonas maritima]|jgi:acyl-CoA reductase-like NAD-dependent aldehyde dehydrogenase|uniref:Aldehyde dehydrogenase n=1 Tax=Neopusillimonas maritima TaxID=2026239 RepID=A0ABX9MU87_9BURK|nr:aldehyde dehydrogenase family protein [Neopusillimonas maritima]RII81649.1 aldehyde dehydrogenase [Neopusillimonas maritima]
MKSRNLIDGNWVEAISGERAKSIDPSTALPIGSFAAGARADAQAAIVAASKAFEDCHWAQNPRLRQLVMLRWADRLEEKLEELATLLVTENGKIISHARAEMAIAISEIRYYAGLARHIPGNVLEVEPGVFSTLLREPAGVAALIIPWNAPVALLIRSLTPALAAGCTVVIKPAPQTVLITTEIIRALHEDEALMPGVVNMVAETGHEVAQEFVTSPDVAVVSFTGSNLTGQRIMAAAAPTMKKLSLELGGKSCALVFEDADIARMAPMLTAGAIIISGQQCTAVRRILVHDSKYEEVKRALKVSFEQIVVGPGHQAGVDMGPMIDEASLSLIQSNILEATDICDEVIVSGGRLGGALARGYFLTPTLVAHDDPSADFCQKELFGPFVVLERFADEAEAIAKTNFTEYGLSASVWTRDGARAMRLARALRNGTVWINDHNKLFAEAETGGYKRSGLGRLHGHDGLMDFMEIKHIYQSVGVAA